MSPAPRPQWQQATALITLGASGIVTGLSFVPKAPADLTSPASLPPVKLLALDHASGPALGTDAMLRAAIVHIARHFMNLAQTRSPAEMEAMIWQYASTDGANHGPSCAAFASLTLELGSHIAGLDSWVTGGTSYPWPVHSWVDGRVDPNPASPGVISVLQDAQSHGRWRPLGDGYAPKPGDWVLFDGHVEVVTKYQGGVLHTIGGDSLPNLSVNAHEYADPLQGQGVAGFVDNGVGMSKAPAQAVHTGSGGGHGRRVAAGSRSPASAPALPGEPAPPAESRVAGQSCGPGRSGVAGRSRIRGGSSLSGPGEHCRHHEPAAGACTARHTRAADNPAVAVYATIACTARTGRAALARRPAGASGRARFRRGCGAGNRPGRAGGSAAGPPARRAVAGPHGAPSRSALAARQPGPGRFGGRAGHGAPAGQASAGQAGRGSHPRPVQEDAPAPCGRCQRAAPVSPARPAARRCAHARHGHPAGLHQRDRQRRHGNPAQVRRAGVRHHCPSHRRVRLGTECPGGQRPQPVRDQGNRSGRQ